MSRSTSGIVFISEFAPTEVEGQYTFENAKYSSQTDTTGNGAYDLQIGYTLHCYATDPNTFMVIPGVVSKYVINELIIIDAETISGRIEWSMPGPVIDWPTNSSYCMISQTTENRGISLPASDALYPELQPGFTEAVLINDISDIIDIPPSGGTSGTSVNSIVQRLTVTTNGKTNFLLSHTPINVTSCTVSVNGLIYLYGMDGDYFIESNILTWTENSIILETSDIITISYTY